MTILHYLFGLPPVHIGGVPTYVLDLVHMQQKLGHRVYMLMPGKIKGKSNKVKIVYKRYSKIDCYEVVNSSYVANGYGIIDPDYFMRPAPIHIYIRLLDDLQIQILHVHSMLGLQKELLLAAKELGIPIVYTSHDYYGLCPKIDLLKNNVLCKADNWSNCTDCCHQAYGLNKLRFRQSTIYRWYCHMPVLMKVTHSRALGYLKIKLESIFISDKERILTTQREKKSISQKFLKLQQYYQSIYELIDYYHFNSTQSREIYEAYLGILSGEVVTITNAGVADHRKKFGSISGLRIGYLGTSDVSKGYPYLLKQLDILYSSGRIEFQLNTYLVEETERRPYQKNHAPFSNKQQEEVYRSMDLLVVPSVCKETFGLVVLEALSYGIPVFVSENVGAKELLHEHQGVGCIFSLKEDQLFHSLKQVYDNHDLLIAMNESICSKKMNFDFTKHVLNILTIYSKRLSHERYC